MKIGLDAKRAFHNRTGLGNYARTLISNLNRYYPDHDYIYFSPSTNNEFPTLFENGQICKPTRKSPLWRSIGIRRDLARTGPDLFHGLSNELPFNIHKTGIPSVVTIHDVIFQIIKKDFPWHDRIVYGLKTRKCIQESSRIVAISEATKNDLIHYFRADPKKINVIYQPIDSQFEPSLLSPEISAEIRQLYNLPSEFMLYVGAIMQRKNILRMVQAWEKIPDAIPLLIFGGGGTYRKEVQEYIQTKRLERNVQLRSPIPFHHLPTLYKLAKLVVYPSLYEGFGLPILEALACGTPIVTSSVSSMPEAGGDLPIYVQPDDIDSISSGMEAGLNKYRMDTDKLSAHLSRFNSAKVTEQLMLLYREVSEK